MVINVFFSAYYFGKKKKRKPGRPPGGHTNLESGSIRPKKKKRGRKKNLGKGRFGYIYVECLRLNYHIEKQ